MARNPQKVLIEIKRLIGELELLVSGDLSISKKTGVKKYSSTGAPKGALGAINMLLDEGFFDSPKEIATVMKKLKEIGHYHSKAAISMNLLNLTKRRTLNRLKDKGMKSWGYVVRR